eukprot:gene11084-12252_t
MLTIRETKREEASEDELRAEMVKLKRQYRYLADDRKHYRNETEHILKKQNHEIANLLKEESDLQKDMNLVKQSSNKVADQRNLEKLHALLDEEEIIKIALQEEMKVMVENMKAIKDQEEKIENFAKEMRGARYDQEDRMFRAEQKSIRTLENRLNQATVKFNAVLARNTTHRQSIEYIAVQRTRYLDLQKKLLSVFMQGKKEKGRLIDLSKELYTMREEAEHRMKYLKDKSERDSNAFNSELKDLVRIIDHDKKLQEFMNTKRQDLSIMYEQAIQQRKDKKSVNNVKVLQKEVENYNEIFKRLVEVSGDTNVDEMVNKFIDTDDKNFALFNYVNEQNIQCKQYQIGIEQLKKDISALKTSCGNTTAERTTINKELEEKYDQISQERITSNKLYKNSKKVIQQAKESVWNLFTKMTNQTTTIQMFLGNSEISEENILQFLGEIERKTNEMLQLKLMIAIKENNEHEVHQLQAAKGEQHSKGIQFIPPAIDIDSQKIRLNDQTLQPLQEDEVDHED